MASAPHFPATNRRSIAWQLFVPWLSLLVVATTLGSALAGWLLVRAVRGQEEAVQTRIAERLGRTSVPLTAGVLDQLSGLTGMEFALFGGNGQLVQATPALAADNLSSKVSLAQSAWQANFTMREIKGPLVQPDQRLVALFPREPLLTLVARAAAGPLAAGSMVLLLAGLVGWKLTSQTANRIRRLVGYAQALAGGGVEQRLTASWPRLNTIDEIDDLAHSLEQMTQKLADANEQLRQTERLRTAGQLGASFAHQVRNGLAGAQLAIELEQRSRPSDSLEVALRQIRLLETFLQRFLAFARGEQAPMRSSTLTAIVHTVAEILAPTANHHEVSLHVDCNWPIEQPRPLDVAGLQQLLMNLVLNAIEATSSQPADRQVIIRLSLTPTHSICLAVLDNGPGPASAIESRLFQPFATDKPDGTGLGLSTARQIAESTGGTLTFRRNNRQTCFEVTWPSNARLA
jgi:signal transduction histidine kinase